MKAATIRSILIATYAFVATTASSIFSQTDQTIYYQYCVAQPDSTCFEPKDGAVDSVGRDVSALGGTFRFCLQLDTIDSGYAPVRVVLVLDRSYSMCQNPADSVNGCCATGDGTGNCMTNDPDDMRIQAAHTFVDSLAAKSPESQIGVVAYDRSTTVNNPLELSSANNLTRIHGWIDAASCARGNFGTIITPPPTTTAPPGGLGKTTASKATYLGLGMQAGLRAVDNNYEDIPVYMSRHIIQLTDGAWDDTIATLVTPDTIINGYKTTYPDRKVPTIHGVFLSNKDLHLAHSYPAEGCSNTDPVILDKLQRASQTLTGGLFIPAATPSTIIDNFKDLLDTIARTAPQTLSSLTVTNTTNGETRTNGPVKQVGTTPTWETTLQNLPVVFGPNVLTVQRIIRKADGTDSTVTTTVTIIRSDRYREALDTDLFKEFCELVNATIRITVDPDSGKQGAPFNVHATISNATNFTLDTVQARLFTSFPDNEPGVIATFHLDGNLVNASGGAAGVGTPGFTTNDMLFGSGAMISGSFTYSIAQPLNDAFVIEEWVKPGNNGTAVLFSGNGIEIGVTAGMRLYLKSNGNIVDSAAIPLDDGVWSHIGVARANGQVTLFINGVAVSNPVDFATPIAGGAMEILTPQRWVVDEVRFSVANRITNEGGTRMLTISTIDNTGWKVQGVASTKNMVLIPPSAWTGNGTQLDFQFTSPVAGRVLINLRQKETGGVGTGWSKNGNPVFVLSDTDPPYVQQAVLTPGDLKGDKSTDKLRIVFSEPVDCAKLTKVTDPSRTFTISRGAKDMADLLSGSEYDAASFDCNKTDYITEITLVVRSGIIDPTTDSIRISSAAAVDSAGNASPVKDGKKGPVVWGPGLTVDLVPISSSESDPMQINTKIKTQLGIPDNMQQGKIIVITSKRPLDTLKDGNGKPILDPEDNKPAFGTAIIYDAVGNLVQTDLYVKDGRMGDRKYWVRWDGTNRHGRKVGQSAYLIRFFFTVNNAKDMESKKFNLRWH